MDAQWDDKKILFITERVFILDASLCQCEKNILSKIWLLMYKDDINEISCGIEHHNKSTGEKQPVGCWKSREA